MRQDIVKLILIVFNINFDYLYNYVLPIKVNKDKIINLILGLGLNGTYNFLLNSQSKARYMDNVFWNLK